MDLPHFSTLAEAIQHRLQHTPKHIAFHLVHRLDQVEDVSFQEWDQGARQILAGMLQQGFQPGDRIVVGLPTDRDFFDVYLACMYLGVLPAFVARPQGNSYAEGLLLKMAQLAKRLAAKAIVWEIPDGIPPLETATWSSFSPARLRTSSASSPTLSVPQPADIIHLQPTSGSTGNPKIAPIRHQNLMANVIGIGQALQVQSQDRVISWLPISHDMGLVSIAYALFWSLELYIADPSLYVRNPLNWLRMISQFKGTLSPAPNSAYQTCVRLLKLRKPKGLDLSSWRVALCGAEPVYPSTLTDFTVHCKSLGFSAASFLPVYGLAEATLAVTLPPIHQLPLIETLDQDALETHNLAQLAAGKNSRTIDKVGLGSPLPLHQLRIGDGTGNSLPEGQIGEIEIKGPSVIEGYWQDSNQDLKTTDDWLRTGDIGFFRNGQLFITGRKKEVIILNGKNFTLSQIEENLSLLNQGMENLVWLGRMVACGFPDAEIGSERLYILAEMRTLKNEETQRFASEAIRTRLLEDLGISGASVLLLPKGSVPLTTSGKIRRDACLELVKNTRL